LSPGHSQRRWQRRRCGGGKGHCSRPQIIIVAATTQQQQQVEDEVEVEVEAEEQARVTTIPTVATQKAH